MGPATARRGCGGRACAGQAAAREEQQNCSLDPHLSAQQFLANACAPGAVDLAISCTQRGAALQTLPRSPRGARGAAAPSPAREERLQRCGGCKPSCKVGARGSGFAGWVGIGDRSGTLSRAQAESAKRRAPAARPRAGGFPVRGGFASPRCLSSPTRTKCLAHHGSSWRQRVFKGMFLTSTSAAGAGYCRLSGIFFPSSLRLSLSLCRSFPQCPDLVRPWSPPYPSPSVQSLL